MSKVIIGGGGAGGIDSDELTASTIDVLAGKKFGGVGSDEVQIGTMPSYGGTYWNRDMGVGLEPDNFYSFFPPGHYASFDSRGSLHRIPIAKVQGAIGATGNKIIPGQSICGVAGTVASMGAQTINPSASQQSIATSGKYMTGNVVVNPIPSNYFDINTGQTSFNKGVVASDGVFNGNKFIFAKWPTSATPVYTYLQDAPISVGSTILTGIRGGSNVTHNKSFNLTPFKTLRTFVVNYSDGPVQFNIHIVASDRKTRLKQLSPSYEGMSRETTRTFTMDISDVNQQAYIIFYWAYSGDNAPPNWDMRFINIIELLP